VDDLQPIRPLHEKKSRWCRVVACDAGEVVIPSCDRA
jgi:hypothetical protein